MVLASFSAIMAVSTGASAATVHAAAGGGVHPDACPVDTFWDVIQVGNRYYSSNGGTKGKYNAGSGASTLDYSESTTTTKTSGWTATAKLTYNEMVVKIEASYAKTVTKSVATGITVTDHMLVDAHHYGRVVPKVEYTNYEALEETQVPNCSVNIIYTSPLFKAITADTFFSECEDTTNTCTPTP